MPRWFGPRPIRQLSGIGWPFEISMHGSCGCCGCGGVTPENEFVKYEAYPNGLRLKLTIEDVPDSFDVALGSSRIIGITQASGLSQYNGT